MEESRGIGCQRGVGMVEILVALLVLAVGVLGYAGLQLKALQGATAAQTRVRAVMLARSALELMKVNPGRDYAGGDWPHADVAAGSPPPDRNGCIAQACDGAAMRAWDIRQLTWQAATDLPLGRIVVMPCTSAAGETPLCVLVSWGGGSAASCIGGGRISGQAVSVESLNCVVLQGGR